MNPIEHVVVLMMENRSFDHLLGFLDHPVRGLIGNECNADKYGNKIFVSKSATGKITYDPHHEHKHVCVQLTKEAPPLDPKKIAMNGFAFDAERPPGAVMRCFDPERLPVLSTLAREFVVCDQWFSSIPGQTWPNRFYAHAGHSDRYVNNAKRLYGMMTVFDRLDWVSEKWRIYHTGLAQAHALWKLWLGARKKNFFPMNDFYGDAAAGNLPAYSFIEPKHMFRRTNSQHPANNKKSNADFLAGEDLIRRVYDAVTQGPRWDQTLLLITYDEHGGFYDHDPPIEVVSPHPGQKDVHDFDFDFTRSGVRVPAVIVSPHVKRGHVDHTPYDHSSIPHSVRERFASGTNPLSLREEESETFWHLIQPGQKREDIPSFPARVLVHRLLQLFGEIFNRLDSRDERPVDDDLDLFQLARYVAAILDAEERGENAEELAIDFEEEHELPAEMRQLTRAQIGSYVEFIGKRFHRRAEDARRTPTPTSRGRAATA